MPPSKPQHQQPKRKRRGKELLSALDEKEQGNDDQLEAVIIELERESERRVKKMRRAMDDMKQRFLNAFQIELLKIPRRIRTMKLGTFLEEFGGSVDEALKRAEPKVAQTPRGPPTSRRPRAGEAIMSLNGSPLAAVPLSSTKLAATVKMNKHNTRLPRSGKPSTTTTTATGAAAESDTQLLVETGNGVVSLSEPDTLKALAQAPDVKSSMLSQLSALQADIANVMKSLQ